MVFSRACRRGSLLPALDGGAFVHVSWYRHCCEITSGCFASADVCREQELKVHQARRSLEEALTADSLARAAENTQAMLAGKTA